MYKHHEAIVLKTGLQNSRSMICCNSFFHGYWFICCKDTTIMNINKINMHYSLFGLMGLQYTFQFDCLRVSIL